MEQKTRHTASQDGSRARRKQSGHGWGCSCSRFKLFCVAQVGGAPREALVSPWEGFFEPPPHQAASYSCTRASGQGFVSLSLFPHKPPEPSKHEGTVGSGRDPVPPEA